MELYRYYDIMMISGAKKQKKEKRVSSGAKIKQNKNIMNIHYTIHSPLAPQAPQKYFSTKTYEFKRRCVSVFSFNAFICSKYASFSSCVISS